MASDTDAPTTLEASSLRGPELQGQRETSVAKDTGADDPENNDSDAEELEEGETHDELPTESNPPLPEGEDPPPLPTGEEPPPLPDEAPPDDGWEPLWDDARQAFYFYNRVTKVTQWENPRVPDETGSETQEADRAPVAGGYNPAIHGDYDPNADYAVEARAQEAAAAEAQNQAHIPQVPDYAATGAFNRFTGRWQAADVNPERHNDEAKSGRQMNAFFDVDAAANSHGGRSLKAERQSQKLSKSELKAFKDKRRERKEEKRRAWLRD